MMIARTTSLALLFAATAPAFGDDAPEPVIAEGEADGAILAYPASFFTEFSPVTARDMINRLPGFSLSDGDTGRRGLADAFGNLLINGERPSDKTLGLGTVLQRIPANQVVRIELIREPLPEYDMRGYSQLANVILVEGSGTRASFEHTLTRNNSSRLASEMESSITRPVGSGEITLGLNWETWGPANDRTVISESPDGVRLSSERYNDQRRYREIEPSISYAGPIGENTRLRVNANAEFVAWRRIISGFAYDGAGQPEAYITQEANERSWEAGLSATVERDWAEGLASTTTFLLTRSDTDNGPEEESVNTLSAGVERAQVLYQNAEEETALRHSFDWTLSEAHSFTFGAEAAFNALDASLALFEDTGGGYVPIPLPVSDTRVEEVRGELFADTVWVLSDTLSLEGGLRYEYSEISQSGPSGQARTFTYLKPRASATWRPGEQRRLRIGIERNVDQLDFGNFASSVDLNSDQVDVGNPDYRPQTDWTLEAEFEQRFNEDASVTLTLGRVWRQDLDDYIAIITPTEIFDAPGNIGDGALNRVTLEWTSPLGWLGLRNATLDGFVEWYDSNVTDPVTGEDRAWSGIAEWELSFDFRQTFPEQQIAWGWDYFYLSDAASYRVGRFTNIQHPGGDLDLYVETTRWFGLTTRLGADFVLDTTERQDRIFYDGSRADGVESLRQQRYFDFGPQVYLSVRGAF
ncbi:TonB-dependent receptor plug domain-containing protein [Oceanicaulis sp. LC35]|uniref:TonB-dependent receptor plug domain-containing protein n=1 Tax=Oceanicaulis sp. LC35 TaxID=3349635 RepID=UPI003F8254F3